MKLARRDIGLIAAAVLAAAGAFYVTVALGQPAGPEGAPPGGRADGHGEPLVAWLGLDREQADAIYRADPNFRLEMRQLERQVRIEQLKLATLVESPKATDEELAAQFERLGQAQLAVHRRVAKHVLAIRPHLNADQRSRFLRMLGEHLRGGGEGPAGRGAGPGRGPHGRPDGRRLPPPRYDGPREGPPPGEPPIDP